MGATQSTTSASTARLKLLEATKTTRTLMDTILEYLLLEVKIKDFYLMSSDTECKKYVLFLANKLASEFIQFQIEPTIDKSGTIAFRSVKDLVEPPEAQRKQRKFLCLQLAYFYVRIFQIYGALALSLLDDATYTQQKGYIGYLKNERGTLRPPGLVPYRTTGPTGKFSFTRKGGSVRDKSALGVFKFLNEVLTDSYGTGVPRGAYRVELEGKPTSTFFSPGEIPVYGREQKGKFTVYITERKKFSFDILGKESVTTAHSIMTLDNLQITGSDISIKSLRDVDDDPLFSKLSYTFIPETRRYERDGKNVETTIWKTSDGTSIVAIMKTIIDTLTNYIRERSRDKGENTVLYRSNDKEYGLGLGVGFEEKEGVDPHLRIGKLVDNLTRRRPLAHCVARGLQLLETAPLGDDTALIESKVCDTRFLESKSSIPMGRPISGSAGLSALANLFYDVIEQATPKVVQSSKDTQDYLAFIRSMSGLFTGIDPVTKQPKVDAKQLDQISSSERDKEICGSSEPRETILLPTKFAREKIYPIVVQLFNRQLQHAANSAKILEQLFLIKKSSKGVYEYHIHPNIFKKGFSEINRIGELTRNVLKNYYLQCENDYVRGLVEIKQFRDQQKAASGAPRTTATAAATTATT